MPSKRIYQKQEIKPSERRRIIGMLEAGVSAKVIADRMDVFVANVTAIAREMGIGRYTAEYEGKQRLRKGSVS